jgi:hypothetical protein
MHKLLAGTAWALLIACTLQAQQVPPVKQQRPDISARGFSIAVLPFSHLDFLEPSANVQWIYSINNRLSLAMETGFIYGNPELSDCWSGWRLRPEVRFKNIFRQPAKSKTPPGYFSMQLMLKKISTAQIFEEEQRISSGTAFSRLQAGRLHKFVTGFNIVFGRESFIFNSRHVYMDRYIGIGVRYKAVTYENRPAILRVPTDRRWFSVSDIDFRNKSGVFPTFLLGFKVGWKF